MKKTLFSNLSLKVPLILAPMTGGVGTPALAAAMANAGGLGSLGLAYTAPSDIGKVIEETRKLCSSDKPIAANLFLPTEDPTISDEQWQKAITALEPIREKLKLGSGTRLKSPYTHKFEDQFEAIMKQKPAVFSFVFGLLPKEYMRECQEQKIVTIGSATTPEEAMALEDSGVDAVVLQGFEAGGHRACFSADPAKDKKMSRFELLKETSELKIPRIAAGGLTDGTLIRQTLKFPNVQAVQIGTLLLLCSEAGTSAPYREALLENPGRATRIITSFSGRPARGLANEYVSHMDHHPDAVLPFPVQNTLTREIRSASAAQNLPDYLSLWTGTGLNEIPKGSAKVILEQIVKDMETQTTGEFLDSVYTKKL